MNICDLSTGAGQLARAFADLKDRLAEIKSQWNDETLRQFEQNHLRDIPPRMQLLVAGIEQLSGTVAQAERELADGSDE